MDDTSLTVHATALDYIARGWPVIPVHGLADRQTGRCTCGRYPCGRDNSSAGKHPVHPRWQNTALMSAADVWSTWMEDGPLWNIGILTGTASGVFVLDIDPKADGLEQLARLVEAHGPLPETYTVRSGSGGRHFYFAMPPWPLANNQAKLASGIDVRGTGGQVVAPPSISAVGAYTVHSDCPVAPAPRWLLDLLVPTSALTLGEQPVIEDLPQWADLDDATRERVSRYAAAVVAIEVATYQNAPPGTGNAVLFTSAANALEIAQSPWNLITADEVVEQLDAARQRRILIRPGGGQDPDEFRKTFQSAQGKVIGQGRALPVDRSAGVMFDHPMGAPASRADAGAGTADTEPEVDPVDVLMGKLLDRDALDSLPIPQPLIRGVLDRDSETWIIGAPGGFKSFVALDWALHVGGGLSWRGKETVKGTVLYLAAEGASGLPLRVQAWEQTYGRRATGVLFLPEPVQIGNTGAWQALVAAARRIDPVLIVLDTQARISVGVDENSATDVGRIIEAVSALRRATGACVLVVHHTGRDGLNARGSSALDGAQDRELRVDRPTSSAGRKSLTATISIDKAKDGDESERFDIALAVCDLGRAADDGRELTSLAIVPHNPFAQPAGLVQPEWVAGLTENQGRIVTVLQDHSDDDGLSVADILRILAERKIPMQRSSFNTALVALKKRDVVAQGAGVGRWALVR